MDSADFTVDDIPVYDASGQMDVDRGFSNYELPNKYLMSKFELSEAYIDPDIAHNATRELLKDRRPDKPFIEHEKPIRAGKMGREIITHRLNGSRSELIPNHKEVYLGFEDPDPRGCKNEPDWGGFKKQMEDRANMTAFNPDSNDQGRPDAGMDPLTVFRNRQRTDELFKTQYARWFSQSRELYNPSLTK